MQGKILIALILVIASSLRVAAADLLFADPIVAKGKGVEVRQSQIDETFTSYKATRAASGQSVPRTLDRVVQEQILDKLIATQLFLARATAIDKTAGKEFGEKFILDNKSKASSEAAFKRQLIALGTTMEEYEKQVVEQAIVKAVIDRELRANVKVTEEMIKDYYDKNPKLFSVPEQVKVTHLLLLLRDVTSGQDLREEDRIKKRALAEKALLRAKAGEDFSKLVQEYSEDADSKAHNGEYTFARGGRIPPEFEAAAFSLKPGQISDIVQTVFGYHVIKLLERIPGKTAPLAEVRERIVDSIMQQETQKKLPGYLADLRKQNGVVVTLPERND